MTRAPALKTELLQPSSLRCGAGGRGRGDDSPDVRVNAFNEQTEKDGRLFATHAAIALTGAQREAQGILMERHDLDDASAFRMLVEASQSINVKLHQAAARLVENRSAC